MNELTKYNTVILNVIVELGKVSEETLGGFGSATEIGGRPGRGMY